MGACMDISWPLSIRKECTIYKTQSINKNKLFFPRKKIIGRDVDSFI